MVLFLCWVREASTLGLGLIVGSSLKHGLYAFWYLFCCGSAFTLTFSIVLISYFSML